MSQGRASSSNEIRWVVDIARLRLLTVSTLAVLAIGLQGCVKTTVPYYETLILPLDGKSELHISTYPSDIARSVSSVPFIWKELQSPDSVFFQVFVREVGKAGRNPHIESIMVHSFSYAFPGQDSVELIADYPQNFWMQGSPEYNPDGSDPVPIHEGWYLNLEIDLTLNGQQFVFNEQVNAAKRERTRPLILHAFR